jgi:hypothetical protein
MAKDLPYFKFFCSEWNDGDIALEDYEVQGLFINLCSYYWSNECNLTFKKAEKKFKDASDDLWQVLLDSNIIKDVDDFLVITFLDEQKDDRVERSKIRSKGGKASAEARRLKKIEQEANITPTQNEHVLNSSSTQVQLLREEEIREEKRKEEKKRKDNKRKVDFNLFWELYPVKKVRKDTESKFLKLKESDVIKILDTLPDFIKYKPFADYSHPLPTSYLSKERWNDEIIKTNLPTKNGTAPTSTVINFSKLGLK